MSELYRFTFRSEFFEIELESTDSDFIDKKIIQLIELSTRSLEDRPKLLAPISDSSTEPQESKNGSEEASMETPATTRAEAPKKKRKASPKTKAKKTRAATTEKKTRTSKPKKTKPKSSAPKSVASTIDPAAIADEVKSLNNFGVVKTNILDKANQLNRILLSFYFAEKVHGKKGLTTGDIESITNALGAEIKSTNVSSQLKKHETLFTSRGERKRGSVVHYKLNKKGVDQFEAIMAGL